jgi:hypothetical protein
MMRTADYALSERRELDIQVPNKGRLQALRSRSRKLPVAWVLALDRPACRAYSVGSA